MHKFYPQILVFLQFGIAFLMVIFSYHFFTNTYALPLFIMGASIGLWALNHNKLGNFNIQPKHKEGSKLITTGIYKLIRHPMYTSVTVMMFSLFIATTTWIEGFLFIALISVLVLKAKREESILLLEHSTYRQYQQRTKLFIPYIL